MAFIHKNILLSPEEWKVMQQILILSKKLFKITLISGWTFESSRNQPDEFNVPKTVFSNKIYTESCFFYSMSVRRKIGSVGILQGEAVAKRCN